MNSWKICLLQPDIANVIMVREEREVLEAFFR